MRFDFGFLDSGTGGLPYLKFLKDRRPSASCVYVGDTKNFPYGEKTAEEIKELVSDEADSNDEISRLKEEMARLQKSLELAEQNVGK